MQLSPADRQTLAERLMVSVADNGQTSLESIDPDVLDAWREEIRRRMDSYRRGETKAIDAEVVFERLRSKYGT
jgi:putative addiction module component (TIGR02574 family)